MTTCYLLTPSPLRSIGPSLVNLTIGLFCLHLTTWDHECAKGWILAFFPRTLRSCCSGYCERVVPNNVQPCLVGSLSNNLHFALFLRWKNPFEFSRIGSPSIFASKAISHVLREINIHDNHTSLSSFCYTCFKLVLWVNLVQCCNLLIPLCLYARLLPCASNFLALNAFQWTHVNMLSFLCSLFLMDFLCHNYWYVNLQGTTNFRFFNTFLFFLWIYENMRETCCNALNIWITYLLHWLGQYNYLFGATIVWNERTNLTLWNSIEIVMVLLNVSKSFW